MESGGEPETKATRLRSSVALRLGCVAKAFGLALEVVMDGSVAVARSNLGLLVPRLRSVESLLCDAEAIMVNDVTAAGCIAGLVSRWRVEVVIRRGRLLGGVGSQHSRQS